MKIYLYHYCFLGEDTSSIANFVWMLLRYREAISSRSSLFSFGDRWASISSILSLYNFNFYSLKVLSIF